MLKTRITMPQTSPSYKASGKKDWRKYRRLMRQTAKMHGLFDETYQLAKKHARNLGK